ncbi:MAG: hypothetical protein NC926_07980 [Candidatus Omnitrophica bacterium]|nr:hypothetical protein [Candidatus Omnitrophota bacterium]
MRIKNIILNNEQKGKIIERGGKLFSEIEKEIDKKFVGFLIRATRVEIRSEDEIVMDYESYIEYKNGIKSWNLDEERKEFLNIGRKIVEAYIEDENFDINKLLEELRKKVEEAEEKTKRQKEALETLRDIIENNINFYKKEIERREKVKKIVEEENEKLKEIVRKMINGIELSEEEKDYVENNVLDC